MSVNKLEDVRDKGNKIVNKSLNEHELKDKIFKNRVRHIFPMLNDKYIKLLSTLNNRLSQTDILLQNKEYIRDNNN